MVSLVIYPIPLGGQGQLWSSAQQRLYPGSGSVPQHTGHSSVLPGPQHSNGFRAAQFFCTLIPRYGHSVLQQILPLSPHTVLSLSPTSGPNCPGHALSSFPLCLCARNTGKEVQAPIHLYCQHPFKSYKPQVPLLPHRNSFWTQNGSSHCWENGEWGSSHSATLLLQRQGWGGVESLHPPTQTGIPAAAGKEEESREGIHPTRHTQLAAPGYTKYSLLLRFAV